MIIVQAALAGALTGGLFAVMAVNLASVWWRCRSSGRMAGFHLVASGAVAIVAMKIGLLPEQAAMPGVMLTLAGSLASVWITRLQPRRAGPDLERDARRLSDRAAQPRPGAAAH